MWISHFRASLSFIQLRSKNPVLHLIIYTLAIFPVNQFYPTLDQNCLISIPYPVRLNCLKAVPFTAIQTFMSYLWKYLTRREKIDVPCSIADLFPYVKQIKHCITVNICDHNRAFEFRRKEGVLSYWVRARRGLVWFMFNSHCHRASMIHRVCNLILLSQKLTKWKLVLLTWNNGA